MLVGIIFVCVAITTLVVAVWRLRRQRFTDLSDKYVLITGCDSGFGNLLAKHLDMLGMNVFAGCLTDAGFEELRKNTSINVTVLQMDITDAVSIQKALAVVKSTLPEGKGLWAVVNNAGLFGTSGLVQSEWLSIDDYRKVMEVNLYGTIEVTRNFLPLVRKARGRIINTTSVAGRVAVGGAAYVCSKFAAEGYAESLRHELYKSDVSVHVVAPSGYRTNFATPEKVIEILQSCFLKLDEERKHFYGEDFCDNIINGMIGKAYDMGLDNVILSTRLYEVVNAYTHALIGKWPRARYEVGRDTIFYKFLWNVPDWLSSYLLSKMWPTPRAMRKTKSG